MSKELKIDQIIYDKSLREVLFEDFKSLNGELPIRGGWGYSIDDAIIIDKNDPTVYQSYIFDEIGNERPIVEKRLYEELIIFKPKGQKYSEINWNIVRQSVRMKEGRIYDVLIVDVTCFKDHDFEVLKRKAKDYWNEQDFFERHEKRRAELLCYGRTEYYFDITSFY